MTTHEEHDDRTAPASGGAPATSVDLVVRVSSEGQAIALYEEIRRTHRKYPIVALTCRAGKRDPALDVDRVRERIWPGVPIYVVEPRESRTLNDMLKRDLGTDEFGVYNGAARVWWPGVDEDAQPSWHPLVVESRKEYRDEALERLAVEFTKIPEALQKLSPREQAAARLRSVPRPSDVGHQGTSVGVTIPLSTRRDLRRLTGELRRDDRNHPLVVLTPGDGTSEAISPSAALRSAIDPHIPIYVLGNDDLCRRLANVVGDRFAVQRGDARIYWPDLRNDSDPEAHPLVPAHNPDDHRHATERLVSALELSRPQVRSHFALTDERRRRAEQQAAENTRALRKARTELSSALARAREAEAASAQAEQQLDALSAAGLEQTELNMLVGLDTDGRLHRLIAREWQRALPSPEDRRKFPPGRYIFGERFIKSVDELAGTPIERTAWVCAMVASGRGNELPSLEPHHFRGGAKVGAAQQVRGDGSKAWICRLLGESHSRLLYWMTTDGLVEFALVASHGTIDRL
jgi:hypothetical protein